MSDQDYQAALALTHQTVALARQLLGQTLASDFGGARVSGIIVETEAYLGRHDPASHAYNGRRHKLYLGVWHEPGHWYVYRSYGIHWCVNITSEPAGIGAAVLIRALQPRDGIAVMRQRRGRVADRDLTNGPGKLCQALGISDTDDGVRMQDHATLQVIPAGGEIPEEQILVTPRIGITRAVDWPLRFLLRNTPEQKL